MHRLAATPGGWNPDAEGVIFVEQTQAPLVFLTAADTDIQMVSKAIALLPGDFPALRVTNLLQLQQQLTIDTYAEEVLEHAKVIVLRVLGGRAYWSYGLEVVKQTVQQTGAALLVLPGDDRPDPDLISHSTVPLAEVNRLWRYLIEGGLENTTNALQFLADLLLTHSGLVPSYNPPLPQPIPRVGLYVGGRRQEAGGRRQERDRGDGGDGGDGEAESYLTPHALHPTPHPPSSSFPHTPHPTPSTQIGILFYRAHYLAGNTEPIDALCAALSQFGIQPVPVFVSSLRDPDVQADLLHYFRPKEGNSIQVLLNTTSFSLARLDTETPQLDLWQQLDVPVIQVILSGGTVEQWETQTRGLAPRDVAMNIALPEVDGRIISRAISFKAVQERDSALETDVVSYESVNDRIQFVAQLAANWAFLRQTPPGDRRIALILANYPTRDGRLANGVGLDTPASCVEILNALQQEGYQVHNIPQTGDELIQQLTKGVTNDPESREWRSLNQTLSLNDYQQYFETLPDAVKQGMGDRWGEPATELSQSTFEAGLSRPAPDQFPIPGLQLGNVFVGIQPSRGYDLDPSLNYHAPDLEPTHAYLAFYHWVRHSFGAQAIVHVGKHGNLEWLPGKSVALSDTCYPEVAFGPLPHLYPFIVNDPGEGSQAKRRAQAVIIDHLTPPMTRAELYGPLQQLEGLIDEYYEAQSLDPTRLSIIRDRIADLAVREKLHVDLGMAVGEMGETREVGKVGEMGKMGEKSSFNSQRQEWPAVDWMDFITRADGYLCELKEAQIRDGLHIFGRCPEGRQLRDLIVAIARHPGQGRLGLTRAIAQDWKLDIDPIKGVGGWGLGVGEEEKGVGYGVWGVGEEHSHRTVGDWIEVLEHEAAQLVETLIKTPTQHPKPNIQHPTTAEGRGQKAVAPHPTPATNRELNWIRDRLLPALLQTRQEITNLLRGLDGRYVASGASGAPTRGRPEVLPTGRNFYSVDIRAIPTESAWDVGRKAAEALIERYAQENGEFPKTLALSIWGTSTMRTGGDDLAEALALLGVRPVWDGAARRVVDFEILPLSALGRPRVDVTLRISGFFRDAFPNLIDLFHQAVQAVAKLDEPADQNPLADRTQQEIQTWQTEGLTSEQAEARSLYRIFGSKPGAYGAGLQGLIEAQNWTDDQDLARAYINWSSYAYTGQGEGKSAPDAFEQRLKHLQIVLHNQDNREHDLLDSDDYYQFQGGLTAAVRAVTGQNPHTYFGDHAIPEHPRIRTLREEIAKVYRSRVVNPKWIEGVMRHGYKGAFEMAATVDYLFAYDATARCVEDHMYQGVAQSYLFDPQVHDFIHAKNPWALRDMAERLLEAHQRGLWQQADGDVLERLRAIALQAEGAIEAKSL